MTASPFEVDGVDAARWRAQAWWHNAPLIDLPPAGTHLVVLAAHPDDETLGVGGLLHAASARIERITVVVASDGAASHPNSSTITPPALAELRLRELTDAVAELAPAAEVRMLGLPDGQLSGYISAIVDALTTVLGEDVDSWLLSTWLDDGHPDHAACALAAREITRRRSRTRHFEYPIWYWHIGDPSGPPESFTRAVRRYALTDADRAARSRALDAYPTQIAPISELPGDEAVLPAGFLAHFYRDCDVLLDLTPGPAGQPEYFDDLYSRDADPWDLADSWYERRKRSLLLASLPRERFRRAFEPGSARGDLSRDLFERVDELWCAEGSLVALNVARRRLPAQVHIEQLRIPGQWPPGRFDLIVLSEIAYYVEDLNALAARIEQSLDDDGVVVMLHWRRVAADHPHTAETVHHTLRESCRLSLIVHHEEDDFVLDVLSRDGRSVAQHEGVI